jgi:hypothetical protein
MLRAEHYFSFYLSFFDIFQPNALARAQALPCRFNPAQKARIIFQSIIEPIIFRLKTNQYARWFAMPCDDDLLPLCLVQKSREIVLDLRQRNPPHARLPNCASHDSASDLATIANISTVETSTS